jgi:hypothetical protein
MINLTEFKITNLSGSAITITSLDNFVLANGAVDIDVFADVNGGFSMEDVESNAELETLLQAKDISIKDQDDGVFMTLLPLYGTMYTVITDVPVATTSHNYNPTGFYNAKIVNIEGSGTRYISGLQCTYGGDFKILRNESSGVLSYLYNNANSLPENRIFPIERSTNNTKKYSAIVIYYDGIEERWKIIDAEKP